MRFVTTDIVVAHALVGLARTLELEQPGAQMRVLLLEAADDLQRALAGCGDDVFVRWRKTGPERRAFGPTETRGSVSLAQPGDHTLITGGNGAIAQQLAEHLATQCRGVALTFVARSAPSESALAVMQALRSKDSNIAWINAHETDALTAELETARRAHGPFTGVLHCAGVTCDRLLANPAAIDATDALSAKLHLTKAMDGATANDPLRYFIGFSSLASVAGNEGQAGYALANGALDGLMAQRADQERPGRSLTVNWGYWRGGGMRVDAQTLARLRMRDGVTPMDQAGAVDALERALASDIGQCAIASGDAATLLRRLNRAPETVRPAQAAPQPRTAALLAKLTSLVAAATKRPADQFLPDEPFASYGIDSLLIVRILADLEPHFGALPRSLLFEHASLEELAAALAQGWPEAAAKWVGVLAPKALPVKVQPAQKTRASAEEEIVIVGLAGRFPGASSVSALWEALAKGHDAIGPIPPDRWDHSAVFDPDRSAAAQGRSYAAHGAFLEGFADFDPSFFGLTPREALEMDPQERLFLMACWQGLESAALPPTEVEQRVGGAVGVFAGVTKSDHSRLGWRRRADGSVFHARASFASVANRVSYLLGLTGPSQPVDTMCSASLTAIHQARQALLSGDCALALAGGVNLYQDPSSYVELCQSGMLSSDGRCRSFGADGAGFGPGEGVGVVVMTTARLAAALNLRIDAVVVSSAINHGGAASGYTVPNPAAQRALIEETIRQAGLRSEDIHYVEAHGTGTALGDPIEIEGLSSAFAKTGAARSCWLGSVKSNIGHLEAAAGVSGVIKAIGQAKHRTLFKSLHADTINPALALEQTPFRLVRDTSDWPQSGPSRSLVSSFGASGSNACVLLEAPEADPPAATAGAHLILLSAKSEDALRAQAQSLLDWVQSQPAAVSSDTARLEIAKILGVAPGEIASDVSLQDLGFTATDLRGLGEVLGGQSLRPEQTLTQLGACDTPEIDIAALAYTMQTGRSALPVRAGLIASDVTGLIAGLNDILSSGPGNALGKEDLSQAKALNARPDIQDALAVAWRDSDFARLLALWLRGITPDWSALWQTAPRRPAPLHLPGYPFAGRRLWAADLPPVAELGRPQPARAPARISAPEVPAGRSLRAILALTMDMPEAEIAPDVSFADYGLDSILGIRFVDAINAEYGTDLKSTAIFEHPTLAALEEQVAMPAQCARPVPAQPVAEDSIAIIGMSGRYSGAETLEDYWSNLIQGRAAVGPVTRWPLPDGVACRNGGFLSGIDQFDPTFFNISGAEARYMDPQQRIVLEECWHALERAGYAGDAVKRSRCGIFIGCCGGDYQELFLDRPSAQSLWGNMASVIPARIAYYLDLNGPAIAIDTACSSSLVAIHNACAQLRGGELDMALAGGVFVQATPKLYLSADKAGMLSPTGQSYSFDARADGFVPGEGAGIVVLKRLSDARRDGDHIDAVILGSQVNQNGKTNGITAPSGAAQARLLAEVYARAEVEQSGVQVIETHGTGTALGDPIEFDALAQSFSNRQGDALIWLTSVKPAIGHTQFAAGVAGLQKLALSLQHGQIPPNLFFDEPNPRVEL
jgi:polyketide synthase PksN